MPSYRCPNSDCGDVFMSSSSLFSHHRRKHESELQTPADRYIISAAAVEASTVLLARPVVVPSMVSVKHTQSSIASFDTLPVSTGTSQWKRRVVESSSDEDSAASDSENNAKAKPPPTKKPALVKVKIPAPLVLPPVKVIKVKSPAPQAAAPVESPAVIKVATKKPKVSLEPTLSVVPPVIAMDESEGDDAPVVTVSNNVAISNVETPAGKKGIKGTIKCLEPTCVWLFETQKAARQHFAMKHGKRLAETEAHRLMQVAKRDGLPFPVLAPGWTKATVAVVDTPVIAPEVLSAPTVIGLRASGPLIAPQNLTLAPVSVSFASLGGTQKPTVVIPTIKEKTPSQAALFYKERQAAKKAKAVSAPSSVIATVAFQSPSVAQIISAPASVKSNKTIKKPAVPQSADYRVSAPAFSLPSTAAGLLNSAMDSDGDDENSRDTSVGTYAPSAAFLAAMASTSMSSGTSSGMMPSRWAAPTVTPQIMASSAAVPLTAKMPPAVASFASASQPVTKIDQTSPWTAPISTIAYQPLTVSLSSTVTNISASHEQQLREFQAFQQQQQREFQERLIEKTRVAQHAEIMAQQVERERQQQDQLLKQQQEQVERERQQQQDQLLKQQQEQAARLHHLQREQEILQQAYQQKQAELQHQLQLLQQPASIATPSSSPVALSSMSPSTVRPVDSQQQAAPAFVGMQQSQFVPLAMGLAQSSIPITSPSVVESVLSEEQQALLRGFLASHNMTHLPDLKLDLSVAREKLSQSMAGPIVIVDQAYQIASAMQELSKRNVLAVDCEGVNMDRTGRLCVVTVSSSKSRFVFDVVMLGTTLFDHGLRALLESTTIVKLFFDCRRDSDALYHQFGVQLHCVLDTQMLELAYRRQHGQNSKYLCGLSRALETYLPELAKMHQFKEIKTATVKRFAPELGGDEKLWEKRPMDADLLKYATFDVVFLRMLAATLQHSIQPFYNTRAWLFSARNVAIIRDLPSCSAASEAANRKLATLAPPEF